MNTASLNIVILELLDNFLDDIFKIKLRHATNLNNNNEVPKFSIKNDIIEYYLFLTKNSKINVFFESKAVAIGPEKPMPTPWSLIIPIVFKNFI